MQKYNIAIPNRPKPYLVEAYNSYYGTLKEFHIITIRFWQNPSPMYNDASLLCSAFPTHISPSAKNGFMNEFQIHSLKECYEYSDILSMMEFYMRNWKYCEYFINSDCVYHNEMYCYIFNLLAGNNFSKIKVIDCKAELKYLRGKWIEEKQLFSIVKNLFPDYEVIYHFRAKWLERLELDIFIKELSLGVEYQGIQHYEVVEHWGGIEGLDHRQQNDMLKKQLCEKSGIKLVYFNYKENITTMYVKRKFAEIIKTFEY